MQPGNMHSLLRRQLKSSFGASFKVPDEWRSFIDMVNSAYHESDRDRNMLERSMELSSLELLQANSEMRAIFEVVPDIFFRIDASGKILDCRAGNTSDLYVTRQELIGKKIYDIPLAPVADKFRKALADVKRTNATVNFEYSLLLHGKENFCEASMIPLPEEQALTIIRNVTDRKNTENALKKSEAYFREITMNSSDVLFIVDDKGTITYASPSAERYIGYRPDELVGENTLSLIMPDDRPRALEDFGRALLMQEVYIPNSFRVRHKNGEEIIMEGVGKNLFHNPAIAGFVMNVRDVTERKRAEEALRESEKKYRLLTEKMTDIVWIADLNLRTLYITPSVRAVLGFSQEDPIPMTVEKQMTPASLVIAFETLTRELALEKEGLSDPNRKVDLLLEYFHKDGSSRWLETTVTGLRDEQGVLTALHGVSRDVTERKKAEDALRASEELYTRLVATIPDIIIRTDLKGRILFINDYALQIGGYKREDFEGQNISIFVTPGDRNRLLHNLSLMRYSKPGPQEYQIIMKDGREIPVEVNGGVLQNENGIPFGLVFVCRDISERKQSIAALHESEEKYRKIFEGATEGIFQTTLDGKYLSMNPAVAKMFGYASSQEMIESVTNIGRQLFVNPEDRERMLQILREQHKVEGFEVEVYRKDKSRFWTLTNIHTVCDDSGNILYLEGTNADITKRKLAEEQSRQSEEQFHTIFMTSPNCIAITRMSDGLIINVNTGFEEMTGWTGNQVLGRTAFEIHFWNDEADRHFMVQELKSGRDVLHHTFQFRRKDGIVRSGVYSARPITIANEACLIFSMEDITDRQRLEVDREKLEQQLFQSQKMESVGRLAGGVAHDFNNMLSVIIGNTEMAMTDIEPSNPLYKSLQDILHAGMRSSDLTRQLLAFARKQTISPKVLDLNDTVSGMLKMLRRLIGEDIDLGWYPGAKLWKVKIDPSQVDQLLANLTVNARDAIEKAGRIMIETSNAILDEVYCADKPECLPGEYVTLAVSDNGCGMDQETLAYIFEPFFTTKKEGQGTGLGLATVYGIAKQNEGFITADSEPGKGTIFKIYLPRYMDESLESKDEKPEVKIQGGTETVLIVEDESTVLKLTQTMLETLGYHVLAAREADHALRLVRDYQGNIDLLISDVVMPNMNGKELSERIIAIKPGIKCLYMSGYTADVIARQGVLDEDIQFISKPFTFKHLAAKVREILE